MNRPFLIAVALFVANATLPGFTTPQVAANAGQPGKKVNAWKVQIRHPGWNTHPVPDERAAKILANNLHRGGWATQIQRRGAGFVVRARIPNWFTRTVVKNKPLAVDLAQEGRSRGFQVRIVPFHQ